MADLAAFDMDPDQFLLGFIYNGTVKFKSARRPNGRFAIAIDASGVFELYRTLHALLACPSTLPGFGKPPAWSGPYGLSRYDETVADFVAIVPGSSAVPELDDPDRVAVQIFCVRAAMDFIFSHELAHVRLGHVDAWAPSGADERRARELHADDWGATLACLAIMDGNLETCAGHDPHYLWGFAVGVMFALADVLAADAARRRGVFESRFTGASSHPRGALRSVWASEALTRFNDDRYHPLGVRAGEGCQHAYRAWESAGWGDIEPATPEELIEVVRLLAPEHIDLVV